MELEGVDPTDLIDRIPWLKYTQKLYYVQQSTRNISTSVLFTKEKNKNKEGFSMAANFKDSTYKWDNHIKIVA